MAEAVVQFFLEKLYELLQEKVQLLAGVENDVRLLRDTLQWIHSSLKKAAEKRDKDEQIELWVTQIRDIALDAEDIIDEYLLKIEQHDRHRDENAGVLSNIVRFLEFYNQGRADIGKDIKDINVRLDSIKKNALDYGMKPAGADVQGSSSSSREKRRRPIIEESDGLVGIENDAETVAKLLVDGETTRRSVVAISGMGGLGKTTLARHVYNRGEVKRHFQCSAWVTVSQEFKVHDLLCEVIRCILDIEKDKLKAEDEECLRGKLLNHMKGKVYLVVLDDIWDKDAWNDLKSSFPHENNGSRILLTTRNKDLALQVDPLTELHQLRFLKEEECWELLCKKAFPRDHKCPTHLMKIGKQVVTKCKGLPLAVIVLGGLLSRKMQTLHEWRKVFDSISWQLSKGDHEISSILALSYNDLPYDLKACFLHFASFPEDSEIKPNDLIYTWIAEGFIKKRGSGTLEDIAEDYLLELNDRSMIQIAKSYDAISYEVAYSIHDLLREIAIRKAKEERFLDVYGNGDSDAPTTARRLAFTRQDDINKGISAERSHRYLRSLYCFQSSFYNVDIEFKNIHGRFKLLRVIHIFTKSKPSVLDEIGHLIHLRYFHLEAYSVISLPSTFCRLYNLQTLRLYSCGTRINIHDDTCNDIWKMKELRHLDIDRVSCFPETAQHLQLSKLTNLQTLCFFPAGDWIKYDLGKMTSLRRLGINGDLLSYQDALVESIGKLMNLRFLDLDWREAGMFVLPIHLSHLVHLESLCLWGNMDALTPFQDFPASLTSVYLCQIKLKQDQDTMAILEKLPKLRLLQLRICLGEKMYFSRDGFPELRGLEMGLMDILEEWIVEDGAMPKLKQLDFSQWDKLKANPEEFQRLKALCNNDT